MGAREVEPDICTADAMSAFDGFACGVAVSVMRGICYLSVLVVEDDP
jgi:hypothetical protein